MSDKLKKDTVELLEDVAIFLYKIVNYFYYVSLLLGIFTVIIVAFYLSGNPVANYTSEKGMLTIFVVVGITALVRFIYKNILSSKNLI
tara:strand:- start:2505 stop:2768 length:264 start_codon:yes stop_codon:yes gene_type:complete